MPLVFSYGTLQRDDVQIATFGRPLKGTRDHLIGYELTDIEVDKPSSVPGVDGPHHVNLTYSGRNDSRVNGIVFELTEAELAAADKHERLTRYKRIPEKLASGRLAWIYVYAG